MESSWIESIRKLHSSLVKSQFLPITSAELDSVRVFHDSKLHESFLFSIVWPRKSWALHSLNYPFSFVPLAFVVFQSISSINAEAGQAGGLPIFQDFNMTRPGTDPNLL